MAKNIENTIKSTVEESTVDGIVAKMFGNGKQKNWEPLAMLLVCKHISDRVYPNNLVLSDGTKIRMPEKNCWGKTDEVCSLLKEKDFFRDQSGCLLENKLPMVKIVCVGDERSIFSSYVADFTNFKDMKSANAFMRAYRKIWKIVADGKDLNGIKVAFVKEAIMKTVQVK